MSEGAENAADLRYERDRFVAFASADAFLELDADRVIQYASGAVQWLAGAPQEALKMAEALKETSGSAALRLASGDLVIVASVARYQDRVNGAIAVARQTQGDPFDDDDAALVADVADRLGIAMEQIANTELLERLSRTDELTGLLNRRAFTEEVAVRLEHHRRTGRPGALLYVDMDNFKLVNDLHGHRKGDEAIREVASMLNTGSRVGDLAARLGGDEFGLWIEDADLPAAKTRPKVCWLIAPVYGGCPLMTITPWDCPSASPPAAPATAFRN